MEKLWKTTIVIWTDYDPSHKDADDLAWDALFGDAFLSLMDTEEVSDKTRFPATDFFGTEGDANG